MPICRLCHSAIPNRMLINGVLRFLNNRKFCLTCSPWGSRNTRSLDKPQENWQEPPSTRHTRDYRRRRKQQMVDYLGGKCILCGYNRCLQALDFHHRDMATKEFVLCGAYQKNWEVVKKELDKCDLLCRNCHAEVHEKERTLLKSTFMVGLAER